MDFAIQRCDSTAQHPDGIHPSDKEIIITSPRSFMNFIHSGYLMCVIIFPPDFVNLGSHADKH